MNMGILYSDQGKLKEAEEMLLRALHGFGEALGAKHTSTLLTVNNLGLLFFNQGKLKEAQEMCVRAVEGYEETLGAKHTSTLDSVVNLGNVYKDQARTYHILEMKSRLRLSSPITTGQYGSHKQILPLILDLCSRYPLRDTSLLGIVGRVLLWTGDRENAQLAFQNQVMKTGDVWSHGRTQCDCCKETLTLDTGRFVCMACSDVDFCEACHREYDILDTIHEATNGCTGHQFLAVPQPDPYPTVSSNNERLSAWMRQMISHHPVASGVERT